MTQSVLPLESDRIALPPAGRAAVGAQPAIDATAVVQRAFAWSVGIESSCLPHLNVDQFDWTQHNRVWRDDLRLVSEGLGLKHLRYAIPWQYLEPEDGRFDWTAADERLGLCHELGIEVMLDVMHFGTPRWLTQAVGDPRFPEALERLTQAMAERYRAQVRTWVPVNEPLVTALFSGDFGFWPPHGRKWRGYMPVLSRIALGVSRAIAALRRAQPEASVVICDAADHFQTSDDALRPEVALRNLRRFLLLDLVMGRVDAHHPLHEWVTAYGFTELDLQWLRTHPQAPDIIGLDYYPHSDWQLETHRGGVRQKRSQCPVGLYGVAQAYYQRFGLPMWVTETSIEGKPINREVWLDRLVDDANQLRSEGVPLLGLTWWPLFDHLDWDGALTHRIGKLHEVGLYRLSRQSDGTLRREQTPLGSAFADLAARGDDAVGELADVAVPVPDTAEQLPPLADWVGGITQSHAARPLAPVGAPANGTGNGKSHAAAPAVRAPSAASETKATDRYGIVVLSHLRWGFVWQRPQQFLSRFARKHAILFFEEPFFDLSESDEPRLELHQVMPNVTVACPHCPPSWSTRADLPQHLRRWLTHAVEQVNSNGAFDRPLLWYYSPMDAGWSLGHLPHRGVVYDCMDELSQFTGAPPQLLEQERRLMHHADVVFTGGHHLWTKKKQQHDFTHFFGCGVEVEHFGKALDPATVIPPDIDFMARPILGWFGVVDERVDYQLVGEMARLRPDWSFAMVGPVVKVDPNLLPHAPNLYWLGGRDYQVLPNYCRAFDICMMCFALNDATEFINPTKALEYLATGRPVISTPVKDVVRQYEGLVDIAATPEAFVAAAERRLTNPEPQRIQRGLERARECSWEKTVQAMQRLIAEGIGNRDRRSAAPIDPVLNVTRPYQYRSTPGS